jgi:hypothetical protein
MPQFCSNIYGCGRCGVQLRPAGEHDRNHAGNDIIAISVWEIFGILFLEYITGSSNVALASCPPRNNDGNPYRLYGLLLPPQTWLSTFTWFLPCTLYSWYIGADTPLTIIISPGLAHSHRLDSPLPFGAPPMSLPLSGCVWSRRPPSTGRRPDQTQAP